MRASAPFRSTTAGVINRARILRPAVSAFPNGLAAGTERRRRRGPPAARGTNSFLRTWWARAGAERGSGGGFEFLGTRSYGPAPLSHSRWGQISTRPESLPLARDTCHTKTGRGVELSGQGSDSRQRWCGGEVI
jgi:hypothetical protein